MGSGWAAGLTLPAPGRPGRHGAIAAKVKEAAGSLQDNHELQTFLQSCREVGTRHGWWHRGVPASRALTPLSLSLTPGWRRRC